MVNSFSVALQFRCREPPSEVQRRSPDWRKIHASFLPEDAIAVKKERAPLAPLSLHRYGNAGKIHHHA